MSEPDEDFAALFEASVQATQYERGQTIEGTIVAIGPEVAFVDVASRGRAAGERRQNPAVDYLGRGTDGAGHLGARLRRSR